MTETNAQTFRDIAGAIAQQVAIAEASADSAFIRLPMRYPGGSSVVVHIGIQPTFAGEPRRYTVSDFAFGHEEAATMGVGTIYVRHAGNFAERAGVKYQDRMFLVENVSLDQLSGAAIAVANCSLEAVAMVAERVEEIEKETEGELLYKRLIKVFSESNVARNAEVMGASTTPWPVDNLVTGGDHQTIFEAVSSHRNSIYATNTKFGDIQDAVHHPSCIAVVKSKPALKTMLPILAKSATTVIEHNIAQEALQRLVTERPERLH